MSAATNSNTGRDRYVEVLEDRDPMTTLRKGPKRARKLLKGRSEKELAWRPGPGKWSVKEILAHHADGEIVLGARLRFAAAMDQPPIPAYDENLFVARLGVDERRAKDFLAAWERARELTLDLLERLPDGAFERTGMHAERGPESVRTMMTRAAGHDLLHDAQIQRTLEAYDASKAARRMEKKAARKAEKLAARSRKEEKPARRKDSAEAKSGKKSEKKLEALLAR